MTDHEKDATVDRVFYDIGVTLESAEDFEARVIRVLSLLRGIVPYEVCAVLQIVPDAVARLFRVPGADVVELRTTTSALLARVGEEEVVSSRLPLTQGVHLAVPLVGLDEVIGVLFVRRTTETYDEVHVRRLSVVAANLAAYLSMLGAHDREAERARQLDEARQFAETANRAKDEFLALVSHELRTPLHTILSWADTLRSDNASRADRMRAFQAIERTVAAEGKIIDDLLDLACVANTTLRLELESVAPRRVIESVISSLHARAAQKSIRLDVSFDESVPRLNADARRLHQIVTSLVGNAIKFTPEGGRVEVRLERAGELARIGVRDTGVGIVSAVLPSLFQPFHQSDRSSTRAYGGLGLGLALVKDLVELHGGRIRAESAGAKQGAHFVVELPLGTQAVSAPRAATDQRNLKGIHVLLVDDDEDLCELLQVVLEGRGASVRLAHSARDALIDLEQSLPDILICDLSIPGQSGYDLMREVVNRAGPVTPPAIALTGHSAKHRLQEALSSGFRVQLEKTIDPGQLIATVVALAKDPAQNQERGVA